MAKINYQNLYQTKDTEKATILYAMKQTLDSTFWSNKACFFVYENSQECERILNDYLNDKIIIGAKSLMEASKTIKNIIRCGI